MICLLCQVMSLANCIEQLVQSEDTLEMILPYILEMLNSPQMDVLAAWYLFDHVAGFVANSCSFF